MIVQRKYKCDYCHNEFWVFQPGHEAKIVFCPGCEKADMKCTEREMKQC